LNKFIITFLSHLYTQLGLNAFEHRLLPTCVGGSEAFAGARVDIYQIVRGAADNGAAVVILSSDGVELEGLCDRVFIMSRGTIIAELEGKKVTEAEITRAELTSTTERKRNDELRSRSTRFRNWMRGDSSPAAVLGVVVLVIAGLVGATNGAYFSPFSLNSILFTASMFILIGAAQHVVVLGSGFDLSVGPLLSFLVVIASFFVIGVRDWRY
jgi:ribose transport system ATP-binding protein